MKIAGHGNKDELCIKFIVYNKDELLNNESRLMYIYKHTEKYERTKMLRHVLNMIEGNNIKFDFVMIITSIGIGSKDQYNIDGIYSRLREFLNVYNESAIILVQSDCFIDIELIDEIGGANANICRSVFLEYNGFRNIGGVCNCLKTAVPYMYINKVSIPLLIEIAKIEDSID